MSLSIPCKQHLHKIQVSLFTELKRTSQQPLDLGRADSNIPISQIRRLRFRALQLHSRTAAILQFSQDNVTLFPPDHPDANTKRKKLQKKNIFISKNCNHQQTTDPLSSASAEIRAHLGYINLCKSILWTNGRKKKRKMNKRQRPQFHSPHTKPSGLTAKILLPFNSWGWAQLAFTKLWKLFSATHCGSHFSWQSHKRLDVFKCLRRVITFNLFCMKCRFLQVN